MQDDENNLPPEIGAKLMRFLREKADGEFEVIDMEGLVKFIAEHGERYPVLQSLVKINEDALIEHYKRTGEVPPGIKLIKTSTREGENVTYIEILHGLTNKKP